MMFECVKFVKNNYYEYIYSKMYSTCKQIMIFINRWYKVIINKKPLMNTDCLNLYIYIIFFIVAFTIIKTILYS